MVTLLSGKLETAVIRVGDGVAAAPPLGDSYTPLLAPVMGFPCPRGPSKAGSQRDRSKQ